jgi:hypothetical protein
MIVSVRLFFDALAGAGSFAEDAMATPIRFMALLGTVMLLCAVTVGLEHLLVGRGRD